MLTGRKFRRSRVLAAVMLLLVLATAGLFAWRWLLIDSDRAAIISERAKRFAIARAGGALPGTPDLADLTGRLARHGVALGAPVFIRIFKREFELELWVKRDDRYHRFAVYPICRWSGQLGPKLIEGDAQAPEGFYTIDRRSMNPNSRWHRAFNLGFPNAFDRAHGRSGSFLMVHGGCSSIGCYAMTNPVIDELWRFVDAALRKGQPRVQVHVLPFRPSADNLSARSGSHWIGYWRELAAGYEAFEATQVPPQISVCDGHYRVSRVDSETVDGAAGEASAGNAPAGCTALSGALPQPAAVRDKAVGRSRKL